ncbi:hypothetical protein SDJN03_03385, partial [Cucurbita argyrosperma subsp. sororia]
MPLLLLPPSFIWATSILLCGLLSPTLGVGGAAHPPFNYSDALDKAVLFFEGQRSGKLPIAQRVMWRGDSALSDGAHENVNLVGGYYDAGDNVKFVWPMAFTVTLLSWTAVEYENEMGSVMQLQHLRGSVRWGADFILQAHVSPTTLYTQEFYKGKRELSKYKSDIESFICAVMPNSGSSQIPTTPGGLLFIRDSTNLQYASTSSMVLFMYSKLLNQAHIDGVHCRSKYFSSSQIKIFAKSQVDYILGENPLKMSYMVGFGSKYPLKLHHRASSIPSIKAHLSKVGCSHGYSEYFNSNNPNPNIHVGAIVGGPNSNDQFSDMRPDHTHSEPTTYMNAAFVGSVAALVA